MYYAVGTQIDLRKPQAVIHDVDDESHLYAPGTRIMFVKFVEGLTVLKINPKTIAYISPASA